MDLASELGEQGFRWIFVVHVHGAPLHIRALDQASDYFHDIYGGRMVNLWGLVPVLGGWGSALGSLTDAEKKEEGVSLHGGMDEHSLMLHLRPELVSPGYKKRTGRDGTHVAGKLRRREGPTGPATLARRVLRPPRWAGGSGSRLRRRRPTTWSK